MSPAQADLEQVKSPPLNTMGHDSEIEEGVDQVTQFRQKCESHAEKFKEVLEECNKRVRSKKETSETCHQEMVDYVTALDHCAMLKAFKTLK